MVKKSENINYHIGYWIFVVLVLTLVFGLSWKNHTAAFYFVCMLLPVVLGTSYFFNYVLVPRFYLTKRYKRFTFYTFCAAVVSVYLEIIVLLFSFVYLVNLEYDSISPNASGITLLVVVLYFLVFAGSFLLMMHQITENKQEIQKLLDEKEKMKRSFLEIMSNRKMAKIPYDEIIYIESLSDCINVHTTNQGEITSKEKISAIAERLPEEFLRIHRSFIVNSNKITRFNSNEVELNRVTLNIGRSYKPQVKSVLNSF